MISIKEEDLILLPNGMDAHVNERIKAEYDGVPYDGEDLSGYMI